MRVAVIGAGLTGSAFARWLSVSRRALGLPVEITLFDKARRPGGRASSHASPREMPWEADLGVSALNLSESEILFGDTRDLSAGDRLVRRQLLTWIRQSELIPVGNETFDRASLESQLVHTGYWVTPRGFGRLVDQITATTPQVTRRLSHHVNALQLHRDERSITPLITWSVSGQVSPHKSLFSEEGFDLLVVTAPPPQSAALLATAAPSVAEMLAQRQLYPQWVMRIRGELSWLSAPLLDPESDVIARVSDEGWKRGVVQPQSSALYCVQARADWSRDHLECSPEEVSAILRQALVDVGHQYDAQARTEYSVERIHRWRYSGADSVNTETSLADMDLTRRLGVCGDSYCSGGGVGALRSAAQLLTLVCDRFGGDVDAVSDVDHA